MSEALPSREAMLQKLRKLAPQLRERGVARIDLFGSIARNEAGNASDVDLLVELSRPMGFEFFALEEFLADALGRPVELSTRAGMRPRVLASAEEDLVRVF
jgi:predicted nucleotidyltransferase